MDASLVTVSASQAQVMSAIRPRVVAAVNAVTLGLMIVQVALMDSSASSNSSDRRFRSKRSAFETATAAVSVLLAVNYTVGLGFALSVQTQVR